MDSIRFYNVIGNERRVSKDFGHVQAPRSGQKLWDVPSASIEDVEAAVLSARQVFQSWKNSPIALRQSVLRKLAEILIQHKAVLSDIIGQETGKSKFMSDLEIDDCVRFVEFNATQSLPDETVYEDDALTIITTHQPLGVVAAICPWNFPLVLAMGKIAAALLMGNCIIIKPSPFTPYSTLKFTELASEVLPPGVLQSFNGDGEVGALLTRHPDIQKISFTGSTATGKKIMAAAAGTLKQVTLELGGNDACIICPDVDVEAIASRVAISCLFHSGQMCVASKRLYVHRSIHERFMAQFLKEVEKIATSAQTDEASIFGPISNGMQFGIVKEFLEDCETQNYEILSGGTRNLGNGLWFPPTVVSNPPDDSRIVKEEQFGPIIPVLTWETEDEVIRRVNDSDCGLGASIWASELPLARFIANNLEVGTVWINNFPKPVPMGHFSGWKSSGVGGEWGRQGLLAYSQTRTLHLYKT